MNIRRKSRARRNEIQAQIDSLNDQVHRLQAQIAALPRRKRNQAARDSLVNQLSVAQNQLELAQARAGFLDTMAQFEAAEETRHGNHSGSLLGQIDGLERTLPQAGSETTSAGGSAAVTLPQASNEGGGSGLVAHAQAWFALRSKIDLIAGRIRDTAQLDGIVQNAVDALRSNVTAFDAQARVLASQGQNRGPIRRRSNPARRTSRL